MVHQRYTRVVCINLNKRVFVTVLIILQSDLLKMLLKELVLFNHTLILQMKEQIANKLEE